MNEVKIEIRSMLFSENDAHFAFVCNNSLNEFDVIPQGDYITFNSSGEVDGINNGMPVKLKMKKIKLFRSLTPKSSLRVTIRSKNKPLQFVGIIQVLSDTQGKPIKMELGIVK